MPDAILRTFRIGLQCAALAPALLVLLAGCSARQKEADAKEVARCRTQVKDTINPVLKAQKEKACLQLEFEFRNKYDQQPEH